MKKIRVCCSRSCTVFGSKRVMEKIQQESGLNPGEKNDTLDLDWTGCLGYCAKSPNLVIDDRYYVFTTSSETVMQDIEHGGEDMAGKEILLEQQFDTLFENDPLL